MANKLIITNVIEDKNKLEHYGVKGMKWGVRKSEESKGPQIKGLESLLTTFNLVGITTKKTKQIRNNADLTLNSLSDAKIIHPPESYLESIKNSSFPESYNDRSSRNCANTTMAYELRRRGYDVKAKQTTIGMPISEIEKSYNIEKSDIQFNYLGNPLNQNLYNKRINDYFESMPDGYRGAMVIVWTRNYGGHIFNMEKINNKIIFIDPQNGRYGEFKAIDKQASEIPTIPNPGEYLNRVSYAELFRTDNLKINEEYLNKQIMKG